MKANGLKTIEKIRRKGYEVTVTPNGAIRVQKLNKETLAPVGPACWYTNVTHALKNL